MFQSLKKGALKLMLGSKLQNIGVSDEQLDMILGMVEKNPDFFKKIQDEVEKKKKAGISESAAMMTVMREHQAEFQKIITGK
jgi:deferrochelatase/peroxidase EfeB